MSTIALNYSDENYYYDNSFFYFLFTTTVTGQRHVRNYKLKGERLRGEVERCGTSV